MISIARVICRQGCFLTKNANLLYSKQNLFNLEHYFSKSTPKLGKRRRIVDSSDEEGEGNNNVKTTPKESPLKTSQIELISPVNKKTKLNNKEGTTQVKPEKATPIKKSTSKSKSKAQKEAKNEENKSVEVDKSPIIKSERSPDTKVDTEKPSSKIKEIKLQTPGQGIKGAEYNPQKSKYHPINDAFWEKGEKLV